jgi:hypothetical protein
VLEPPAPAAPPSPAALPDDFVPPLPVVPPLLLEPPVPVVPLEVAAPPFPVVPPAPAVLMPPLPTVPPEPLSPPELVVPPEARVSPEALLPPAEMCPPVLDEDEAPGLVQPRNARGAIAITEQPREVARHFVIGEIFSGRTVGASMREGRTSDHRPNLFVRDRPRLARPSFSCRPSLFVIRRGAEAHSRSFRDQKRGRGA